MKRRENIERLKTEEYDLCIIGAGASGAGCALEATLNGLKVALIDKGDFASGTSSKSTKLIHGGVRYLERALKKLDLAQLRQVKHGLEERHILLNNAPHLAHPVGLITPVFSWWAGLYYFLGLWIYELIASRKDNLPTSKWLNKAKTKELLPGISDKVHSSVLYYDGQLDDARYCLAVVQSAVNEGAVVANYLEVTDFQKDELGKITSVAVADRQVGSDTLPFKIRAKQFLNCTGPFSDKLRVLANPSLESRIKPSKGVHLMLPLAYFHSEYAMLIPKTKDGRVIFAIPFKNHLLVGTTDDPYSDLENEPTLKNTEAEFLMGTLQPYLNKKIERGDIQSGFGGLRPLVLSKKSQEKKATKSLLRDHEVEYDPDSNLVSLLGGKWTTYRLMASDTIRFVCQHMNRDYTSKTADYLLVGAVQFGKNLSSEIDPIYLFESTTKKHLIEKYGSLVLEIAGLTKENPNLAQPILTGFPNIKAEVIYAARSEMAVEIRDFLARRIRMEILDWEAVKTVTPIVAELMGKELGWSESDIKAKSASYIALISKFQLQAESGNAQNA